MPYGCFTVRHEPPDLDRAAEACAAAAPLWSELVADLSGLTKTPPSWRFYGRNHGWALAFKKGGRALAALFPDRGRVTVLVVLTGEQADRALADPALSAGTRGQVASLPRFREGCWVFLPLEAGGDPADARRLIAQRLGTAPSGG
jgi:hypothetical protein